MPHILPSALGSGPPRLGATPLAPHAPLAPLRGPSHLQQPSRGAGMTITAEVEQMEVLSFAQPHTAIGGRAARTETFGAHVLASVSNS